VSKTRVIVAALLIAVTASLTGCEGILYSTYHDQEREGGVTPTAAETTIESVDGITNADYSTFLWASDGEGGLFASEGMNVILNVTVDPEWSIADPELFLGFLAQTAWSVNENYPDGEVIIALNGGISQLFDWDPVGAEVFDNPSLFGTSGYVMYDGVEDAVGTGMPIAVYASQYGETFGRWPGQAVDAPAGMLVNEPPVVDTVPAIANPILYEIAMGGECYRVLFDRGVGDAGTFPGDVTVDLLTTEAALIETVVAPEGENNADFCFDPGTRPQTVGAILTTEDVAGFEPVSAMIDFP
jgi:hypothetical protein